MFGREREQPGILVEPNPEDAIDPNNQSALVQLRNKLWYDHFAASYFTIKAYIGP